MIWFSNLAAQTNNTFRVPVLCTSGTSHQNNTIAFIEVELNPETLLLTASIQRLHYSSRLCLILQWDSKWSTHTTLKERRRSADRNLGSIVDQRDRQGSPNSQLRQESSRDHPTSNRGVHHTSSIHGYTCQRLHPRCRSDSAAFSVEPSAPHRRWSESRCTKSRRTRTVLSLERRERKRRFISLKHLRVRMRNFGGLLGRPCVQD